MKQRVATIFCLAALLFFVIYAGYVFAALTLGDPDTAFIVAIGRWIIEHGSLPPADAFSWTLSPASAASPATPYVCYQWLAAVIYAGAYNLAGPAGVITCGGALANLALFIAPLFAAFRLRLPIWATGAIVFLLFSACSFRLPARPELFSYAFIACGLSAYLCYLSVISASRESSPIAIKSWTIGWLVIFTTFVFWANLHTGFVIGFSLLALLFLSTLCITRSDVLIKRNALAIFMGISFVMIHLAVLINANGFGLFLYLPRLFFMRANRFNIEQMPIPSGQLFNDEFWAFSLLSVVMIVSITVAWLRARRKPDSDFMAFCLPALTGLCVHAVMMIGAAMFCRRLVPFASIEAAFCTIGALGAIFSGASGAETRLEHKDSKRSKSWLLPMIACGAFMLGLTLHCSTSRLALPNISMTLGDLDPALHFIQNERPRRKAMQGRLYNDAQFGDLIMLRWQGAIPVAMDTRFDLYGDDMVMHYWRLANARGDFREDLDKEKVQWLFFPPQAPIVSKLALDPDFETVFRDAGAVILLRKH